MVNGEVIVEVSSRFFWAGLIERLPHARFDKAVIDFRMARTAGLHAYILDGVVEIEVGRCGYEISRSIFITKD